MENKHEVQNLHKNRSCQIDGCSCGQCHLSVGKRTLHMNSARFFSLAMVIQCIDWEAQSPEWTGL